MAIVTFTNFMGIAFVRFAGREAKRARVHRGSSKSLSASTKVGYLSFTYKPLFLPWIADVTR